MGEHSGSHVIFLVYVDGYYMEKRYKQVKDHVTKHSIGIIASALYWLLSLVMALEFSFILKTIPIIKRIV